MNMITGKAARAKGMIPRDYAVEDLLSSLPADGTMVTFWESAGHLANGQEGFFSTTMRATEHGIECLAQHVEDKGTYRVILIHPIGTDRKVRILTTL